MVFCKEVESLSQAVVVVVVVVRGCAIKFMKAPRQSCDCAEHGDYVKHILVEAPG